MCIQMNTYVAKLQHLNLYFILMSYDFKLNESVRLFIKWLILH